MNEATQSLPGEPAILEPVYWLNTLNDPVVRAAAATRLIDAVRVELLVELAAARRIATYQARAQLMAEGHGAAEASRILAARIGASPQTVARLVSEYSAWHQSTGEQQ